MQENRAPFRALVAGLSAMGAVVLRGETYSGEYLAMLVAINPEEPDGESARTPQVIAELGRLTAAAFREKELREVEYRIWRDGVVHVMTNDVETAENAGFDVKQAPDSKGKERAPKCPSTAEVEVYCRTLPEYLSFYKTKLDAEETWSTLHAAYTAAQARQHAMRAFALSGGVAQARDRVDVSAPRERGDEGNRYHPGTGDAPEAEIPTAQAEQQLAAQVRTPIPPLPGRPVGPPPSMTRSAT